VVSLADKNGLMRCDLAEGVWSLGNNNLSPLPDRLGSTLQQFVVKFTGCQADQVIPTAGSDELIELIPRVFLNPNDIVVVLTPTFERLLSTNIKCGVTPLEFRLSEKNEFVFTSQDFNELKTIIREKKPKILWLANPNNPTGLALEKNVIAELCSLMTQGVVVIDEAYQEYLGLEVEKSCISLVEECPNLVVLRTFSKAFLLAGIRLGYGVASGDIADLLNRYKTMFQVSTTALEFLESSVDATYISDVSRMTRGVQAERAKLFQALSELKGYIYTKSVTNVFIIKHRKADLYQELLSRNILTKDCSNEPSFQGEHFVRVSIQKPKDNDRLIEAFKEIDEVFS